MGGIPVVVPTALLLIGSNVFMTFAWNAHLKNLNDRPFWVAARPSLQQVITLGVFVPFAVLYPRLDYLWAALCLMAAVPFIFRGPA